MSNLQVTGNAVGSGTVQLLAPATNNNRVQTLPDASGSLDLAPILVRRTLTGSAQQEITDIPDYVNHITVDFAGVSGGTNDIIPRVQLGVVGGSYTQAAAGHVLGESAGGASAGVSMAGVGAGIFGGWASTSSAAGRVTFTRLLHGDGTSRWVFSVNAAHLSTVYAARGAGYCDFAQQVDRLRFTSAGANFTGGQIVVRMEA